MDIQALVVGFLIGVWPSAILFLISCKNWGWKWVILAIKEEFRFFKVR